MHIRVLSLLGAVLVVTPEVAQANCREVLRDMRSLVAELKGFERSQSFASYGFGVGGPHSVWLDRAHEVRRRHDASGPFVLGQLASDDAVVLPGDIIGLGLVKVQCYALGNCDQERIRDIEQRLARMRCR